MLTGQAGRRRIVMALMLSVGIGALGGCSRQMLATFFDLPQPAPWMKPSLALSGQVGWGSRNYNSFNWGAEHGTFTDLVITASLPVAISDHFTVKPTVSYSTVLDRTIRTKDFKNDNVIWGVVLSASL